MVDPYKKLYADLCFERYELFELIQKKFHPTEVLYPGCSVHITPAFFFPYVVFVDKDPKAKEFFADQETVLEQVMRQRRYRRNPFIQFVAQDFNEPLPVRRNQFDLVLAFFTGGVAKACKQYIKRGGLLVTNNHHGDGIEAAQDGELVLTGMIEMRQGKYQLLKQDAGKMIQIGTKTTRSKRYLRETSQGVEYVEAERYYVFEKSNHPMQIF